MQVLLEFCQNFCIFAYCPLSFLWVLLECGSYSRAGLFRGFTVCIKDHCAVCIGMVTFSPLIWSVVNWKINKQFKSKITKLLQDWHWQKWSFWIDLRWSFANCVFYQCSVNICICHSKVCKSTWLNFWLAQFFEKISTQNLLTSYLLGKTWTKRVSLINFW